MNFSFRTAMEFTCVTQVTCTYGKFRVRVSGACIYALAHVVYAGVFILSNDQQRCYWLRLVH